MRFSIKTTSKKIFRTLSETIFPRFCANCGREGYALCPDCLSLIDITEYRYCPFCRKRLLGKAGKCSTHRKKYLDGLDFAVSYQQPIVKNLIQKFKYNPFQKELAQSFATLIITHFLLTDNQTIIEDSGNSLFLPVPLSSFRRRWRGFNQSEEIAKYLSKFFGIPFQTENLRKIKKTSPQVELKKEARERNIKGAFILKNPQLIQGKKIFLVDDVFTTGSTMEECAKILKQGGAKKVWGLAVARE